MINFKSYLIALLTFTLAFSGCKKDDPDPDSNNTNGNPATQMAPLLTRKVNTFIKDVMSDVYYWNNTLPTINLDYEFDSKKYFEKLLNKEDKWSFISDNITEVEDSFEGIETTFGYSLAFGSFVDGTGNPTGNYFAIIEYVYPNTPAAKAGFKRGDIITRIGGTNITSSNYMELFNNATITVSHGEYTESGISEKGTISMTAEKLELNPVVMAKVIDHGGVKAGYLFYTQYIGSYNGSLDSVLTMFKDQGITQLVLDLRYNPGGQTTAAQHLCSSLAPVDVVNAGKQLVSFKWNQKYQDYWQQTNNKSQLGIYFNPTVPVKLGLNKVYILTTDGTASASELTITGLDPYMEVVTVGKPTYGKYTASITLKPEDMYESPDTYKDFKNWGIQPIVIQFANSLGVTDFKDGFTPDIDVADKLLPAFALGDPRDPLLSKALEHMTGVPVSTTKSAVTYPEFKVIHRGFSKFDDNKRNMPLDDHQEELFRLIKKSLQE